MVRTTTRDLEVLAAGLVVANLGCMVVTWATISPGCEGPRLANVITYVSALAPTVVSIVVGIANDQIEGSKQSLGGVAWVVTVLLALAQLFTGFVMIPDCSTEPRCRRARLGLDLRRRATGCGATAGRVDRESTGRRRALGDLADLAVARPVPPGPPGSGRRPPVALQDVVDGPHGEPEPRCDVVRSLAGLVRREDLRFDLGGGAGRHAGPSRPAPWPVKCSVCCTSV